MSKCDKRSLADERDVKAMLRYRDVHPTISTKT